MQSPEPTQLACLEGITSLPFSSAAILLSSHGLWAIPPGQPRNPSSCPSIMPDLQQEISLDLFFLTPRMHPIIYPVSELFLAYSLHLRLSYCYSWQTWYS